MSLQEKLLMTKKELEKTAPPEAVEIIHRSINDLSQSAIMKRIVKVGDNVPAFELPNANDQTVRSNDLINKGPVALYFYRGIW